MAETCFFLRAVHTYERAEMTTVFVSFRDVAQLAPPTICSLLLSLFSLSSVSVAAGSMMLVAAGFQAAYPGAFDAEPANRAGQHTAAAIPE